MRFNWSILFSLFTTVIPGQVLKCLSGHTLYANQCTSTSYCVTIRSKSGQIQRSCDGNNLAQISLCSIYAMHGYPKNVYTEYSSQPVNMGGPIQSSQISNKNSRHSRSKIGSTMCFDGGDLGEVCCCNTDYCNSSKTVPFSLVAIIVAICYWNIFL